MNSKSPLVTVRRNGKSFLRTRPAQVRLTAATRESAGRFAASSLLASQLLATCRPLIATEKGQRIYHRLLAAIVAWKQDQHNNAVFTETGNRHFAGFRFVKKTSIAARCKTAIAMQHLPGQVEIQLPALVPATSFVSPPGCSNITLQWMAVSCLPLSGEVILHSKHAMHYTNNMIEQPPQSCMLATAEAPRCLVLAVMAVFFDNIKTGPLATTASLPWMPGGIVGSWYKEG